VGDWAVKESHRRGAKIAENAEKETLVFTIFILCAPSVLSASAVGFLLFLATGDSAVEGNV